MNKQLSIPFYEHALPVTFFAHTASSRKGCIFYFHGGGLVFGTSDDLPGIYRNKFTQAGYDFISLSYPLWIMRAVNAAFRMVPLNVLPAMGRSKFNAAVSVCTCKSASALGP